MSREDRVKEVNQLLFGGDTASVTDSEIFDRLVRDFGLWTLDFGVFERKKLKVNVEKVKY